MKRDSMRVVVVIGLFVMSFLSIVAQPLEKKSVLILHSYHQGYEWNDSVSKGIMENLSNKENLTINVEYLDSIRYSSEHYVDSFEAFLKAKYGSNGFDFSLIICSDDPALQFIYTRRQIFGDIPVVFCGINNFEPDQIKGMKNVTGVTETISIEDTIMIALKLSAHAKKIAVVAGSSISEQKNIHIFKERSKKIDIKIPVLYYDNLEPEELQKNLRLLHKDDIVFYLTYWGSPSGKNFSLQESIALVKTSTEAGIYSFWDFTLPFGIVGGKVAHGYSQGESAAMLANKILAGVSVSKVSVVKQSPNKYMFNGKELTRLHIDENQLPAYSILMHRQVINVINEYHAGKQQSFFTHEFFDNHGTIMMLIDPSDGVILDANKAAYEFYGYPSLDGMNIQSLNTGSPEEVKREMQRAKVQYRNYFDFRHKLSDGRIRDVEVYSYPVKIGDTEVLFSIVHDVTERVQSEIVARKRNTIIIIGAIIAMVVFGIFSIFLLKNIRKRKMQERLLKVSEERYRTLFDTSRQGIIVADAESGRFIQVNTAMCNALGYSSEEMSRLTPNDIHPKDKLPDILHQFEQMAQGTLQFAPSVPVLKKNGTIIYMDITSTFIELEGTRFLVGFFNNVSARMEAEQSLRLKVEELEYLNTLMTGREVKMIALKKEINVLCAELGKPPRYETGFADSITTDTSVDN